MGFGRLGEQVLNTPVSGWPRSSSGVRAELVARRQVEPGEHHDLVAWPQVLGTFREVLIEADPRARRAFTLVRRSVEGAVGCQVAAYGKGAVAHVVKKPQTRFPPISTDADSVGADLATVSSR